MSAQTSENDLDAGAAEPLVVVRVEDMIQPALTGRTGGVYESPPQPRDRAIGLVCLLLGCGESEVNGHARWVAPIAAADG